MPQYSVVYSGVIEVPNQEMAIDIAFRFAHHEGVRFGLEVEQDSVQPVEG